jgi:hypothetical protein
MRPRISIITAVVVLIACTEPTAPIAGRATRASAVSLASVSDAQIAETARPTGEGSCTFSRGVTTCVSTTQYEEGASHIEYSGCLYGPNRQAGSRQRTFDDTYLVTVTTTTSYRGRSDHAFDSQATTSRQLERSTLVSDVCQPL